jgi:hypothetical protein
MPLDSGIADYVGETPSDSDIADYVAEMCAEMIGMTARPKLQFISILLQMTGAEAAKFRATAADA